MANIFLKIGKGIEVAAEDLLGFTQKGNATAQGASPAVLAALGVLASGVEKALTDTAGAAANPILGLVEAPAEIADFKAVWPEVKSFLATLGIKV